MRVRSVLAVTCWVAVSVSFAHAQRPPADSTAPLVTITGPTVIAFWRVPSSDAELDADPVLAMGLDNQQYFWAAARDSLESLGIRALDQPGRSFRIDDGVSERTFQADDDSSAVGYVFVAPGSPMHVHYRILSADQVTRIARTTFGGIQEEPVVSWIGLFRPGDFARLENENRIRELCPASANLDRCYRDTLAPSLTSTPLYREPDTASAQLGNLVVASVPGRGLFAYFQRAGSGFPEPFTPDLFLADWGYGPFFHQTISARRGSWFQLPAGPWDEPVWIRPEHDAEWPYLVRAEVGDVMEFRDRGWYVVEVQSDALLLRPEQPADMWCEAGDPPAIAPTQATRFMRADLVDGDGHLLIRPKYMKGC